MTSVTPNAQRLLRSLMVDGPAYRADLARVLDVSRATVSNLTNTLLEEGWIEEPGHDPGAIKTHIGTSVQLGVLVSMVFLVDSCTVTLSRSDGRVVISQTLHTDPSVSAEQRLHAGADLVDRLFEEVGHPRTLLRAVHLAVDTQIDAQTGLVYAQRASSRWYGVNPKVYLETRFEVSVHLQNTARLEGLAESLWGAGADYRDVLYVDVSFGVTSGHVVDGLIRTGARGGSGELGHTIYDWNGPLCTCGNAGCLMQYVSVPALLRDYQTSTGSTVDWGQYCSLVTQGDEGAVTLARRAAEILGRVLVNTCHLVDPEVIVLNGELVRCLPTFIDDTAASLRASALPLVSRNVTVLPAQEEDVLSTTALAGVASLRRIEDVVVAVTGLATDAR